MNFNLVVLKNRASQTKKSAGGSEFWNKFWKDDITDENRTHYQRVYGHRKGSVARISKEITQLKDDPNAKLYAEIKLDSQATSKSSSPNEIWTETGLEIVAAKDDSTFVISGTAEEFKKLESVAKSSSFDAAYTGAGVARKKDKNLARELFAVSAMKDRNATLDGRTDLQTKDFIESSDDRRQESIIELYSNQSRSEYNNLYELLSGQFQDASFEKRDERLFYNNMSFIGNLLRREIRTMLESKDFNFVSKIREMPYLVTQRCIPGVDLSQIQLLSPLTGETVALIDSGVYHPLIIRLRTHHLNHLQTHQTPDENHGTFVASRILFGSDIFQPVNLGIGLHPSAKLLDVQVLYRDGDRSRVNPEILKKAILEVVTRFPNVAIYNLSIAEDGPIKDGDISELTEFLDHIARKHDVIFVCSVGNQQVYTSHSYSQTFKQKDSWVAAPGDALNVISVGSISTTCTVDSICLEKEYPSPFTRVGGLGRGLKKPELVEDGGNIKKDPTDSYNDSHMEASSNQFGVQGINRNGLSKDIGTSQSSPLITRECVLLLDYLKKTNFTQKVVLANNRANLIKALLIHSTSRKQQAIPTEETQKHALGFGIPSHVAVLKDNENQLTLVYADGVNFVDKKHKIRINLPEYLLGKKVDMTLTLVYNPPVDKNYPQAYKMAHLDATLRLVLPTFGSDGSLSEKEKYISLNPPHSWENYRHESHAVVHFKKTTRSLSSQVLEVLLQLSPTRPYENKIMGREAEEIQNYAFVLTLTDKTESNRFRQEVLALNEIEEIIESQVQIHVER